MGGIHQPHHRMIDVGVEHHPVDQLGLAANNAGDGRRRQVRRALAARIAGHPDEDQALALGDGIGAHADAADIDVLVADHGGYG